MSTLYRLVAYRLINFFRFCYAFLTERSLLLKNQFFQRTVAHRAVPKLLTITIVKLAAQAMGAHAGLRGSPLAMIAYDVQTYPNQIVD